MLYFKKNDNYFYRFKPETFTCTEVFSSVDQARVVTIRNESIYNESMNRVQSNQFLEATAEEFAEILDIALTRLGG
jgi:hypothetical protein